MALKIDTDVLIVGGGPAGLVAARKLARFRPLVLEAEEHVGGRVRTRHWQGTTYEMGAFSALAEGHIPKGLRLGPTTFDNRPIALWSRDRLVLGETPLECLRDVTTESERRLLEHWADAGRVPRVVPYKLESRLAAFHRVIHPGEYRAYSQERRADALRRFRWAERAGGNERFIAQLAKTRGLRIVTGARVSEITRDQAGYVVRYSTGARAKYTRAKAVIMAVPAPVALDLYPAMPGRSTAFLRSVRYARWTAVAVALRATNVPASYVALATGALASIHFRPAGFAGTDRVATIYFHDNQASGMHTWSEARMARHTLRLWEKLGLDKHIAVARRVLEIMHWRFGAPLITPQIQRKRSASALVGAGAALAGDYLDSEFPYGLAAAVRSGDRAASLILDHLREPA